MDFSPFSGRTTTWMQPQLPEQTLHSQDERSPQRNEAVGEVMLGASEDVSALSSSLANSVPSHQFYASVPTYFPTYNSYPLQSYGQQSAQWNLPLSTYSSLNGATTSQSTSQPQTSPSPVQQVQSPVLHHHSPPPQQSPPQQQYQSHHMSPTQSHHMSPTQTHMSIEQVPLFDFVDVLAADACPSPSLMLSSYSQSSHSSTGYSPTNYYYGNHQQTLSLNPSLLHVPSHSPPAQTSQTPQQQITLPSPIQTQPQQQELHLQQHHHSSSPPVASSLIPSKASLVNVLKGLLSARSLPSSPTQIIRTLVSIGPSEVDLADRLSVLSKIRDHAGNDFYQAWASNVEAMDIIREWLKAAVVARSRELDETVMPLLHVIDRLPLTIESLKSAKLGKVVRKLKEITPSSGERNAPSTCSLEPALQAVRFLCASACLLASRKRASARFPSSISCFELICYIMYLTRLLVCFISHITGVKDMASNLETRWRALVHDKSSGESVSKNAEGKIPEDSRVKKRKVEEPAASKLAPPPKRVAVVKPAPLVGKAVSVKRELKGAPAVKDAKSDSSFFSAPKPKPKLPSFKKAPIKKEGPDPNVAQPSAVDPFKDALAAMTRSRSSPTPVPIDAKSTPPPPSHSTIPGRKKKRVTFKSDDQLVQVKLIERAIYDDDATNGDAYAPNVRDLDRDEGAAMHKHIFEEQIDWTEPLPLAYPEGLDRPKGEESQEKITQEEREKSALTALYMSPGQIPESPAEPVHQIPEDEVDKEVKHMLSGNEVRELDLGGDLSSTVGNLISQLGGVIGAAVPSEPGPSNLPPATIPQIDLKSLGLDMNVLAQIAAQTSQQQPAPTPAQSGANGYSYPQPPPSAPPSFIGDQGWSSNTQYPEYGQNYEEEGGQRPKREWDGSADHGWRGRGRGSGGGGSGRGARGGYRGTKRKICNFYAQGRRANRKP
ncbi:hypothetical protein M422DRAFT_198234 [Sphaerobolus stellatus SS14]|nr:hypothetical protein M422DRAFT_198234 [Sphaerobolus stellatus SS14]